MGNSNHIYHGAAHRISLSFDGAAAENGIISLYDLTRALIGFERSLALTTHFVLHDEVITQVTSLRGAQILCSPAEIGSYKVPAYIAAIGTAIGSIGSLESTNPIGHMVFSVYSLAVESATGQAVDYEKTLQQIYRDGLEGGTEGFLMPTRSRMESLVEKIEPAVADMHRPLIASQTAEELRINEGQADETSSKEILLNNHTFDGLRFRRLDDKNRKVFGKISSFNMNTFNGRMFALDEERPIPFSLSHAARTEKQVKLIGQGIALNISDPASDASVLEFDVLPTYSRTGRVTKYLVIGVRKP